MARSDEQGCGDTVADLPPTYLVDLFMLFRGRGTACKEQNPAGLDQCYASSSSLFVSYPIRNKHSTARETVRAFETFQNPKGSIVLCWQKAIDIDQDGLDSFFIDPLANTIA